MQFLRREYDNPWLCAGDFNEILSAGEQFGGHNREEWQMEGFRDVVDECGFEDLGYSGLPYTWDNRQQGSDNIKVRLDRALGDERFQELFYNTTIKHVQTTESDHWALLISIQKSAWIRDSGGARPFRYENAWAHHDRYEQIINEGWKAGEGTLAGVHASL